MTYKHGFIILTVVALLTVCYLSLRYRNNKPIKLNARELIKKEKLTKSIETRNKPLLLLPVWEGPYHNNNAAPIMAIFMNTRKVSHINCGLYNACVRWSKNGDEVYMSGGDEYGLMKCQYYPDTGSFSGISPVPGSSKLGFIDIFDVSPDGSKIITIDDKHGIRVFDTTTGKIKTIIKPKVFKYLNLQGVSYSPNGEFICFTSQSPDICTEDAGDHYQYLWIARKDGSDLRRLGYGVIPQWYMDNNHIITTIGDGEKLVVYNTANDTSKTLWRAELGSSNIDDAVVAPDGVDIIACGPFTNGGPEILNNGRNNEGYFLLNPRTGKIKKLHWLEDKSLGYTIDFMVYSTS